MRCVVLFVTTVTIHLTPYSATGATIIQNLTTYNCKHPIMERGDVATLKRHFDGDWVKFIYAWALREPPLVEAYYSGGFAAVEKLGDIKYEFIPSLAVKWMKPDVIQEWDHEVVKQLALAFATNLGAYKRVKKNIKKLPGFGAYSMEHIYRTACLMVGMTHPSRTFIRMGSGADYSGLKRLGIHNMADFERHCPDIDAGVLAYLVCMSGKK